MFAVAPVIFYLIGNLIFFDQLVIVVLTAFFPFLVTTVEGLSRADRELIDVFDSLRATKWQKLWHLEIPTAMYMALAGSRITLTMCVIGAVIAEMEVGKMSGLGFRIKEANAHFHLDEVFAGLAVLVLISVALYQMLNYTSKRLRPWAEKERP